MRFRTKERVTAAALLAGALAACGLAVAATGVGTPAPDVIRGTSEADSLRGAGGADLLLGSGGDDVIYGERGNDVLVGGPGSDLLFGGGGNDRLRARDGDLDVLSCGPGRDSYVADEEDEIAPDCEGAPAPGEPGTPASTGPTLSVTRALGGVVVSSPAGIRCGKADGTATDCSESYRAGTRVSLTAEPADRLGFFAWTGACAGQGNPCVLVIDGPKSVSVEYNLGI